MEKPLCAGLATLIIEKRRNIKRLNKKALERNHNGNNLARQSHGRLNENSVDFPPPLPNSRPPLAIGSQPNLTQCSQNQLLPPLPLNGFNNSLPEAPGTCTLPRRSVIRDESVNRYRSPSNPPPISLRQVPPYSIHQPPDPPNNHIRRPAQPPPPPRVPEGTFSCVPPYKHLPPNAKFYQDQQNIPNQNTNLTSRQQQPFDSLKNLSQWREQDSGFDSLNSRQTDNFPRNSDSDPLTSLPSKSTEDLLNASRVPKSYPSIPIFSKDISKKEVLSSDSIYPPESNSRYGLFLDQAHHDPRREPFVLTGHSEMVTFRPRESPLRARRTTDILKLEPTNMSDMKSKFQEEYLPRDEENAPKLESRHEINMRKEHNIINKISSRNEIDNRNELSDKERVKIMDDLNTRNELKTNHKPYTMKDENVVSNERNTLKKMNNRNELYICEENERSNDSTVIRVDGLSYSGGADKLTVKDVPSYPDAREEDQEEGRRGDGCSSSSSSSWMEWTQQLQAYVAWVNSQLRKRPDRPLITDLRKDFQNGVVFADLIEIIDIGVGPDNPIPVPDKTPKLIRRKLSDDSGPTLRRQPILTNTARTESPSPLYENILPNRTSHNRWAYDSLRASHKFYWGSSSPVNSRKLRARNGIIEHAKICLDETTTTDDALNSTLNTSRCTSLNTSLDGDAADNLREANSGSSYSNSLLHRPAAMDFWQDLQTKDEVPKHSDNEESPFRYHTIHRMSGRRKLPQIPGQSSSPTSTNNSRGTTPLGMTSGHISDNLNDSLDRNLMDSNSFYSSKLPDNASSDETSREPEGRSQNSSPATSLVRAPFVENWREMFGLEKSVEDELKVSIKELKSSRDKMMGIKLIDKVDAAKGDSANLRQEVIKHILARQTIEKEKIDLSKHIHDKDNIIAELRKQILQKDKNLYLQRAQFEEALRNIQNGKPHRIIANDNQVVRSQGREELQLVREAIFALRSNFRGTDPNQHTLDTLEQAISVLIERSLTGPQSTLDLTNGIKKEKRVVNGVDTHTKIIYFTDRTVTPFMSSINKRIGDVTLRDFKDIFDRSGSYRYHFKSQDPEYGLVKEEVTNEDDILPGIEGKIIAWVEEDVD